jgi:hypothetical protein
MMVIGEEIAYFEENRARLLSEHEEKFALIEGPHLWGVYETAEEACDVGSERFGGAPFLVAHVTKTFLIVPVPSPLYADPC